MKITRPKVTTKTITPPCIIQNKSTGKVMFAYAWATPMHDVLCAVNVTEKSIVEYVNNSEWESADDVILQNVTQ